MSSLLRNQPVADAIANMLAAPLYHPGDPETKKQPAAFVVPQFRVAHQPKPYVDAITAQNQTIAEVIVYYVEATLGQTIAATDEIEALRQELATALADADDAYNRGYATACNQQQQPAGDA